MANLAGARKRRYKENTCLAAGVDPYTMDKSIFSKDEPYIKHCKIRMASVTHSINVGIKLQTPPYYML